MEPKVFVIIVTYKGKQWYDRCFTSLRESTLPVQTIVVDNASNDGTVEYIRENYPEIILMENKENMGFGKGNNLALRYAYEHGCDYTFLLNQDAWLDDNAMIETLVGLSEQHPEYGILCPMHLSPDKASLNMMLEKSDNRCSMQMLSDLYCGASKEVYETDYVNAAAWLLPRTTLSILGGFDPLIFLYGEDDDYVNRAHFHGLKVGVSLDARVVHDHKFNKKGDLFEMSDKYARKSELEDLELLLNINKRFDYHALRRYYFRKYLKGFFSGNRALKRFASYRFKFIGQMRKGIEFSRKMNKIKQPNWIIG